MSETNPHQAIERDENDMIPRNESPKSKVPVVLITALGCIVLFLSALIVHLVVGRDNRLAVADTGSDYKSDDRMEAMTEDEDFDPFGSEPDPDYVGEESAVESDLHEQLKWLPNGFLDVFDSSLTAADRDAMNSVRDYDDGRTINLSGTFSDYPIVMELTMQSDGHVSGRYAYRSTLERYGRGESNWFQFAGQLLSDQRTNDLYMGFVTRNPQNGATFEYALLECNIGDSLELSGRLCNIKYIEDPNGHWYFISLSTDN